MEPFDSLFGKQSGRAAGSPWVRLAVTMLCLSWAASALADAYVDGEVIVKFRAGVQTEAIGAVLARHGCALREQAPGLGIILASYPDARPVNQVAAELAADQACEFAHPNYLGEGGFVPNDTSFNLQWHHENTGQSGGTPGADLESVPGWDLSRGSSSVVVAVLDSGIDSDHIEFVGRYLPGHDFVNEDANPEDDHSHGTYVTGLLAASANNAFSVAGVDHFCTILPVKVLNANNGGTTMDLIQGLDYAAAQGADVISMSLINYPGTAGLQTALQNARNAGSRLIACAGNGGIGNADVSWPGASPLTISVGATDHNDARASYSGTGLALDVVAPGHNVRTVRYNTNQEGVVFFSGCSGATPVAAGIASLVLAIDNAFTHDDVMNLLIAGADDQVGLPGEDTPGRDNYHGHGRVNMLRTLQAAVGSSGIADLAVSPRPLGLTVSPNPVRARADFRFEAVPGSFAAIEIFDAQGRFVERLLPDPERSAENLAWTPGHALPAGVYFARLTAREQVAVIKFAFVQ